MYSVSGTYFESCNCDPICPCRMTDGIAGGRSTYGVCFGALAWQVEDGHVGDIDVSGLRAVLTVRYDDDELGSPWTIVLHVDASADEAQRAALADVFLGTLGGPHVGVLPWVRKTRHLVDVRTSPIDLTPDGDGYRLRVGDAIRLRATRPVSSDAVVRCGIPGYDQPGHELVADELTVDDDPFAWELSGNCAFASRFAYASA
ncbi:MAG TPA: DUF1326 domain-containing protein [Gaiellaceae bacterium]|jgi:hypothetical protein|nr:DUF1326 domain-containing protein [Gaiellaceae bacterium]